MHTFCPLSMHRNPPRRARLPQKGQNGCLAVRLGWRPSGVIAEARNARPSMPDMPLLGPARRPAVPESALDPLVDDEYELLSERARQNGGSFVAARPPKLPLSIRTHPSLTLARYLRSISQSTQSRGTTHVATLGDLVTYVAHILEYGNT